MTQGVPAWDEQGDDSSVKGKGQAGGWPWMTGVSEGIVFSERLRVSEVQGSPLGHLYILCEPSTTLGSSQ